MNGSKHTAHPAHVILIIRHGILLILIDPLVEISLEEVHLALDAQQPRPELFLELLLPEDQLDGARVVADLAG